MLPLNCIKPGINMKIPGELNKTSLNIVMIKPFTKLINKDNLPEERISFSSELFVDFVDNIFVKFAADYEYFIAFL